METRIRIGATYAELLAEQDAASFELARDPARPPVLLLGELRPVITLGRRADPARELAPESAAMAAADAPEILATGRGGQATWHGPGQWVVFPVMDLERLTGSRRGVRRAIEILLETAIAAARDFGVDAWIEDGARAGVWCSRGKLASVGIEIRDGWLRHGLALNVVRHPESFRGLRRLCGLDDATPAFLSDCVLNSDSIATTASALMAQTATSLTRSLAERSAGAPNPNPEGEPRATRAGEAF